MAFSLNIIQVKKTAQEVVILVKNKITQDESPYKSNNIHKMTHNLVTDIVEKF